MPRATAATASPHLGHPSERSELRYGVRGLSFGDVCSLSPPRGLHWEGYKVSHMVKVSAPHVLDKVRGGIIHDS